MNWQKSFFLDIRGHLYSKLSPCIFLVCDIIPSKKFVGQSDQWAALFLTIRCRKSSLKQLISIITLSRIGIFGWTTRVHWSPTCMNWGLELRAECYVRAGCIWAFSFLVDCARQDRVLSVAPSSASRFEPRAINMLLKKKTYFF